MADPSVRRRFVSAPFGLLVGLIFGPLIAYVLVHQPDSEVLGPYPPYIEDASQTAMMIGLCCGPPVGLIIALMAQKLQRWIRGKEVAALPVESVRLPSG